MKRLNIAITMNLDGDGGQSIWYNGGNQHCVFLYLLLRSLPLARNVWLCGNRKGDEISPDLMLDEFSGDVFRLNDVIADVDLLIDMNANIGHEHAAEVHRRGGRCVAYRFGNEYVMAVESCSLDAHQRGGAPWVPNRNRVAYDEVWTNPQHARTCRSFFEALYGAPVKILGHLWAPYFIERLVATNEAFRSFWSYRDKGPRKSIGIYEPNLNVVKSSIIPMLIADRAYRDNAALIEHIYVTNTAHLIRHPVFSHIALGLETCRSAVATIDPRFPFVAFAAEKAEVVVSHQFENALNYLFYEALHGGYPLIHNSDMLDDAGYRYDGFDVDDGARALSYALHEHDREIDGYCRRAQQFLQKVSPASPQVIDEYDATIASLMARPAAR